ncbi:hypothetical protein IF1G_00169 [Cordyceps javanica]|uniref:Uncharacterized protein n=1 Tax=Cordyceps javanica TaxID=43265 RepID=A0A545VES7_9HYPO|nr:hypothetical protein IF1G_00169 [Cordyceps javanica]
MSKRTVKAQAVGDLVALCVGPLVVVGGLAVHAVALGLVGGGVDLERLGEHPGRAAAVLADKGGLVLADAERRVVELYGAQLEAARRLDVLPRLEVGPVRVAGVGGPDADPGARVAAARLGREEVDDGLGGRHPLRQDLVLAAVAGAVQERRLAEGGLQGAQEEDGGVGEVHVCRWWWLWW